MIRKLFTLILVILLSVPASKAEVVTTVRGIVVDSASNPIPGAVVSIEDMDTGSRTVTDAKGRFNIKVPIGKSLRVTCDGYQSECVDLFESKELKVVLKESNEQQKVNVAYGVQKKSDVVGSVSTLSSEKLNSANNTDVSSAMTGKVAGLSVSDNGMRQDVSIVLRGASSWNGNKPLILVDGVERDVSWIIPNQVESISVLKDASSTAVYGSKGANGVILVTTKTGKYGISADRTTEDKVIDDIPGMSALEKKNLNPAPWIAKLAESDSAPASDSADYDIKRMEEVEDNAYNHRNGWKDFASSMVLATPDKGVAFTQYGKCTATLRVGNLTSITLAEETQYPFEEYVSISVKISYPDTFPIYLRIPSWCDSPSVRINGAKLNIEGNASGKFIYVLKEWANEDKVVLSLPMKVSGTSFGPLKICREDGSEISAGELSSAKVKRRSWPEDDAPFSTGGSPTVFKGSNGLLFPAGAAGN